MQIVLSISVFLLTPIQIQFFVEKILILQKRRSGRNVKRKRYVEAVDLSFSGDEEDGEAVRQSKKNQQIVELTVSNFALWNILITDFLAKTGDWRVTAQ